MYLVTGATGVIGRPLVTALTSAGLAVRAVSRRSDAALPDGVELVSPGNLDLTGVESLFVHPRATKDYVDDLLRRAVAHDVRRVVVLSAINADDDPAHQPSRFNGDRNTEVERAVVACGLPWVSVRPSSFAMNTLTMWRGVISMGDKVFGPYAAFSEAVIHERDVADVIARAMVDDALDGRRLSITGPEALSLEQLVTIIGAVIGKPLRYQEVPAEAAASAMIAHGLNEGFVRALMNRYARELERRPVVTEELPTILGRPARPFAEWVADHRNEWV
ncbi:NmrA family NAD(P)-binding protein [Nocardia xishanensis]|uniref:SDR family oxidoreductase n=1 Tax=Nocardia xishanensis TaxID=238964 RepID=UPI0033EFC9D5